MADLRGRVAVVTGGSRGIGRGIAEGLAEAGATVYVTDRSGGSSDEPQPLTVHATARRVDELGGRGIPVVLDHYDDEAVAAFFVRLQATEGRLDLLVNNASQVPDPVTWDAGFWELPLQLWDEQCRSGLHATYVASVHAARLMVPAAQGLIVNVSCPGVAGHMPSTACGVVKAGLERMARDMARELAGHKVTALALWPGLTATGSVQDALPRGALEADRQFALSPRYVGRCVAALAMDPDVAQKSGGTYQVATLAQEYRFSDPDQQQEW